MSTVSVIDPSIALTDSTVQTPLGGKSAESIVAELHGKYYTQTYRGNVFHGSTAAAGVVIPIYTTLTVLGISLWNPAGSGVNVVPIALLVGWTATTSALGTIGYTYTANAGNTIGATAPIVAFGTGSALSCFIGGTTKAPKARFTNGGTTTLVAASNWFRSSGITTMLTTAASGGPMFIARDDFDGTCVIAPSTAIHVMGSTAVAATATMTLIWEEVAV